MTCSRLLILGALLTIAPPVTAQPAPAKAPVAKAAPAAKAPAGAAKAAKAAPGKAALAAPAGPAAPAQYPPGLAELKVRTVRNQVEVAGVERRAAKRDDLVMPGQKVATQAQSSAEVVYADGTRIIVHENSELSVYGVAPPPPVPGKKAKKAPAFKPGTTTLLRGEVLLIVPAPVAAPAPPPAPVVVKGKGKVKVAKAPKKAAVKVAITATVATPVGKVVASPGSEVRIFVEQNGMTRVAVYSGQAELQGKGKPIVLAAGVGSRLENAKTAPKPPSPLPPAPTISGVQQLSFSAGQPVDVKGSYAPAAGTPPPVSWRVTVARDAAFDDLVSDVHVAGTETRLMSQRLEPGDYYARVSAIGIDGTEGKSSAAARVRVARVNVIPGSEGKRAAVSVEGKDLYCALDGAPLNPALEPLPLTPAKEHLLRCATVPTSPKSNEQAEQRITAAQSGPLVARLEPGAVTFTPADQKAQISATGQRQVTLVLSDAAGTPLSGAAVRAEGVGGVQVGAIRESATPGSYVASVTWPTGQTNHVIRYTVNEVETYEGHLPDALPPQTAEAGKEPSEPTEGRPPKRFAFELGLFPTAGVDVSRLVFDVGGGLDIGGRIRLPYGALAFALRPQYEYYPASPAVAHAAVVGLPITFRIRRDVDKSDIVPYLGVLPQFIADYSYLAKDGTQVGNGNWNTSFGIGGLIGTEFRIKRGAVFVEGGYRAVLLRTVEEPLPSLNGIFANLGFRLTF